jgi:multiple sugar transport system ATP-binding protein
MRAQIKKLHRQVGITFVYVTHDQVEAMSMASRITIMDKGEIQQVGTPDDVYNRPANIFVAGFIGSPAMNFFDCEVKNGKLTLGSSEITVSEEATEKLQSYSKIKLGIRPEHITIGSESLPNGVKVVNDVVEYLGASSLITTQFDDGSEPSCCLLVDGKYTADIGETAYISCDIEKMNLFDLDTGKNILI